MKIIPNPSISSLSVSSIDPSQSSIALCSCFMCLELKKIVACIDSGLYPMDCVRVVYWISWDLSPHSLLNFFNYCLVPRSEAHVRLSSFLPEKAFDDTLDDKNTTTSAADREAPVKQVLTELEICCYLLLILYLLDNNKIDEAKECSSTSITLILKLKHTIANVDGIASKLYLYYSLLHEWANELDQIRGLVNLLLRNYLHFNLYDQAEKFRSKVPLFQACSYKQFCQYNFYVGKIQTIQLEYSEAKKALELAAQLAPASPVARVFRILCNKWAILV
ncbi:hypothetical protein UlMin_034027, partial [Ulmus minor]